MPLCVKWFAVVSRRAWSCLPGRPDPAAAGHQRLLRSSSAPATTIPRHLRRRHQQAPDGCAADRLRQPGRNPAGPAGGAGGQIGVFPARLPGGRVIERSTRSPWNPTNWPSWISSALRCSSPPPRRQAAGQQLRPAYRSAPRAPGRRPHRAARHRHRPGHRQRGRDHLLPRPGQHGPGRLPCPWPRPVPAPHRRRQPNGNSVGGSHGRRP